MEFIKKAPLYAIDRDQINDLVFAENIHFRLVSWLKRIDHFPIEKSSGFSTKSGLLLFERFTPFREPWASDYSTKIFEFYKYISTTNYYEQEWFNGYGIRPADYGSRFQNEPDFYFEIPEVITLTNPTNKVLTITYLIRSFFEYNIFMLHHSHKFDFYVKQVIRIEPNSSFQFLTPDVLFCSLVIGGDETVSPQQVGIPPELDYSAIDQSLETIKNVIEQNFPFINQCLNSVDYGVFVRATAQSDGVENNFIVRNYYDFYFEDFGFNLQPIPDWYYFASLIYANNDEWQSGEDAQDDLGQQIDIIIEDDYLYYYSWKYLELTEIGSDLIIKPLQPFGLDPSDSNVEENIYFSYKGETGIHLPYRTFDSVSQDYVYNTWIQGEDVFERFNFDPDSSTETDHNYLTIFQAYNAYTHQAWFKDIDVRLYETYSNFPHFYQSYFVDTDVINFPDLQNRTHYQVTRKTAFSQYNYLINYDCVERYCFYTPITESFVENPPETELMSLTGHFGAPILGSQSSSRSFVLNKEFNRTQLPSFIEADTLDLNYQEDYSNTILGGIYLSKPSFPLTTSYQEVLDFVDTVVDSNYEDNDFMPDSLRIVQIHEALNAGKYAIDPNDTVDYRFANLGYYIERIARVLGISVEADGAIRSVRQRSYLESGETIPAGWPIGQWGRNQGGSNQGQQGGLPEQDRDGIAYPVISNKFDLDPFTGEPTAIKEGGYALCENLIQYLETFKDDLDKALGLQYAGANSFPLPDGKGDISFEGLSILVQENAYMLSQLSRIISSAQISSLVTQAMVVELLAHQGVPTTVKNLVVDLGGGEQVNVPYAAIQENAPSSFDQTLWMLANLAPLLGGKINFRKDKQEEVQE